MYNKYANKIEQQTNIKQSSKYYEAGGEGALIICFLIYLKHLYEYFSSLIIIAECMIFRVLMAQRQHPAVSQLLEVVGRVYHSVAGIMFFVNKLIKLSRSKKFFPVGIIGTRISCLMLVPGTLACLGYFKNDCKRLDPIGGTTIHARPPQLFASCCAISVTDPLSTIELTTGYILTALIV